MTLMPIHVRGRDTRDLRSKGEIDRCAVRRERYQAGSDLEQTFVRSDRHRPHGYLGGTFFATRSFSSFR